MPTQEQVLRLLDAGLDYRQAGHRLGVPAGQAYLVATGVPADGGDVQTAADRPGALAASTQHLVNPHAENPVHKELVAQWLADRVSADAQMREAAARRDAAPGAVRDPDAVRDVTTVLTRDHNRITALVKQLDALPGRKKGGSPADIARRQSIVDLIAVALAGHEPIEQEYLWPAVRRRLRDGKQLAERALHQEREGTDTIAALLRTDPATEEFDFLVGQLVGRLRRHVAFEDMVFARIREEMGEKTRRKLGKKIRRAQKAAPTRPHPHAPQRPAAAVQAAGAAAAAADRLRDAVGGRPADRRGTEREPDG